VAIFEGHTQGVPLGVGLRGRLDPASPAAFDRTARCYDVPDPLPKMGETADRREEGNACCCRATMPRVEAVAVSPDGQLLATGSWDAQLLIPRTRDGKKNRSDAALPGPV